MCIKKFEDLFVEYNTTENNCEIANDPLRSINNAFREKRFNTDCSRIKLYLHESYVLDKKTLF